MNNSHEIDLVQKILSKTIDEFEKTEENFDHITSELRNGIKSGKLKDVQWVSDTLNSDLIESLSAGDKGENSAT